MIRIFQDEATSFYFARQNHRRIEANFIDPVPDSIFTNSSPVPEVDLAHRFDEARSLYNDTSSVIVDGAAFFDRQFISEEEWACILAEHESRIREYSSEDLSISLTPFYVLRTVSYLRTVDNPAQAKSIIDKQDTIIRSKLSNLDIS